MKKYLRPLGLVLAFAMLTAGAYAAASGDSLISLRYLQDTFFPKAVQAGEETAGKALQETYDDALDTLNTVHGAITGGSGSGGGYYSDTLQRRAWSDGQIITLATGGGFLMEEGSATLVHTGAVIDITAGSETASGAALIPNHRYLVGENTEAAVTVRSGAAAMGVQGSYALVAGKGQHTPFYDVSQIDWFYTPVGYAYERGLFSGVDAGHFSPGTAMNRAMLMSVLHRLAGSPAVVTSPAFHDVPGDSWYAEAVRWGASQGITSGTGEGNFSPNGQVTREQAVAMLYNYASKHMGLDVSGGGSLSGYGDLNRLSDWARPAMSWAVSQGIISGAANNGALTLDPQRGATRAEMATMLQAFCEKIL
ncbi:MAG: S-layer homology domain-containing protein [Lawsonibacter sp.]|nr:S-layer homology domain-containing protein [Lawsonibacter sp.]